MESKLNCTQNDSWYKHNIPKNTQRLIPDVVTLKTPLFCTNKKKHVVIKVNKVIEILAKGHVNDIFIDMKTKTSTPISKKTKEAPKIDLVAIVFSTSFLCSYSSAIRNKYFPYGLLEMILAYLMRFSFIIHPFR